MGKHTKIVEDNCDWCGDFTRVAKKPSATRFGECADQYICLSCSIKVVELFKKAVFEVAEDEKPKEPIPSSGGMEDNGCEEPKPEPAPVAVPEPEKPSCFKKGPYDLNCDNCAARADCKHEQVSDGTLESANSGF